MQRDDCRSLNDRRELMTNPAISLNITVFPHHLSSGLHNHDRQKQSKMQPSKVEQKRDYRL
jgi:hypothetical protein